MNEQKLFLRGTLCPLTASAARTIAQWEYPAPYAAYSYKGFPNGYLLDETTWGTEQFCLMDGGTILGQVSCQFEDADLWVGWSMAPAYCGKGCGTVFVRQCVKALRAKMHPLGRILLRVAAWNLRAINAYQKAGFVYVETIQDEIAYSDCMEDFWVMALND